MQNWYSAAMISSTDAQFSGTDVSRWILGTPESSGCWDGEAATAPPGGALAVSAGDNTFHTEDVPKDGLQRPLRPSDSMTFHLGPINNCWTNA